MPYRAGTQRQGPPSALSLPSLCSSPLNITLPSSSGGSAGRAHPRRRSSARSASLHHSAPASLSSNLADIPNVSEIIPGKLYISDLSFAENPVHLSKYGITHILSTLSDKVKVPSGSVMKRKIDIKHKQIHIDDLPFAELIGFFPETTSFISEALAPSSLDAEKENKVLVHCHEGISRSTSVVSAYLMQKYGMSPQEALAYVKSKRRVADPNLGFVQQLNEYRDQLAASSSTATPASSTSHL